jgi:hypothetical protein
VTPDTYLRLMAHDLAVSQPLWSLRLRVARAQAVAQAFTMLGLLSAADAGAALSDARRASALHGVGGLESWDWRGTAEDYWTMRARGQQELAWIPRSVAAGTLRLSVTAADMRCDWFRAARAGVRFQVQGAAMGPQLAARHADVALAELSAADDAGRSYRLRWDDDNRQRGRLWFGEVVAEPVPEHEEQGDVAWLELSDADGPAGRVAFAPQAASQVGTAAPAWPTPAECYLGWLSRQDPAPELGLRGGREVVAGVAESLLTVGAMPAQSTLLTTVLGRHKRSPHPDLPAGWPHAVRIGTPPDLQLALCIAMPFQHAAVVIEGISAWDENVQLHVYGWPWIRDQQQPTAIPSFTVRATDDLGHEYEGHGGSWRGYGAGEGHGDFTLWPRVPRRAGRLRVVISTLWEARWAEITLPSR